MSEPDALRCPGCGEQLPASVEAFDGALRCARCGVEVPIPEPPAPDLAFDERPAELPAPDAAAEPVTDLPAPPRTLDIEHWFQDAEPSATAPPTPEGLPTIAEEEPPTGPPAQDGAEPLAELTPAVPPPEAEAAPEPAPPDEPPPLPTEPPALPPAPEEAPPPLPDGLVILDAPVPGVPLLPTPPVLSEPEGEPEVLVPDDALPVVRPVVRPVSPARTDRDRPRARPAPKPRHMEESRPRPQVGLALFVMVVLLVVVATGLGVIGYAIWSGLQTAAKPRRATAMTDQPRLARSVPLLTAAAPAAH